MGGKLSEANWIKTWEALETFLDFGVIWTIAHVSCMGYGWVGLVALAYRFDHPTTF